MDIVKENENFRAYLVNDDSADKPYDEGAVPVLVRYFHDYRGSFEAVNDQGEDYAFAVTEAYNRMNRDMDLVARYLRIFHGAYSIMEDSSSEGAYLAFDTAAWRETVGLTDEYMSTVPKDVLDHEKLAEGSLNEIMAWTNGEVYGFIVEKRFETSKTLTDPVSGVQSSVKDGSEWIEVESCYGFYGDQYAREAAEEAFDAIVQP